MPDRFYRGMPATEAMGQLNGLNSDVQAVKEATAAGVASAAQSAQQAAAARDAALQAWGASTAPAELLAAISGSAHKGSVIDVFLYDTSKDSDGGAWRQRCRHTTWENEALVPGKWLGQRQGFVEAWAAPGAIVGDYFQSTVTGLFYKLTTLEQGGAQITRGNTREFPALAAIVAESSRVVIYDATKPDLPMWMVFELGFEAANESSRMLGYTAVSCITALNGSVFVGHETNAGHVDGLTVINFPVDDGFAYTLLGHYYAYPNTTGPWRTGIAARNAYEGYRGNNPPGLPGLSGVNVRDLAVTTLPDAPINQRTGLPTPTLAVASDGGVSVFKHDGALVNIQATDPNYTFSRRVAFLPGKRIAFVLSYLSLADDQYWHVVDIPNSDFAGFHAAPFWELNGEHYSPRSIPALMNNDNAPSSVAWSDLEKDTFSHNTGITRMKSNPSNPEKGMVAYITEAYSSGWQVGDSRGAWLADTTAETISSAELVTNGTFDAGLTGWSIFGSATVNVVDGTVQATSSQDSNVLMSQVVPTVAGRIYTVTARRTSGTLGVYVDDATVRGPGDAGLSGVSVFHSNDDLNVTFTAVSTSSIISLVVLGGAASVTFDNVSVRQVVSDRSITRRSMRVNGTITKAPVAPGAQLVAYSGFSTENYLEQPYNLELDFGNGDFCVLAWVRDGVGFIYERGRPANQTGDFSLYIRSDGMLRAIYQNIVDIGTEGVTLQAGQYYLVGYMRSGGTGYFAINDRLYPVQAGAGATLTAVGAVTRIGNNVPGVSPFSGHVTMVRVSATCPSADQIAQIYRDELPLFQSGAKCTIAENSNVRALSYDEATGLLHVGNGWGYRSAFQGLLRVESEWLGTYGDGGAVNALSAAGGSVLIGSTNTARYTQPAMLLRDELRRRAEARRAMAREEIPLDFDGIAAQTIFPLPIGFTAKGVFVAGTKKRRGPTKDYTVTFDGYRETVVFGVSPGATWVQITATRSL